MFMTLTDVQRAAIYDDVIHDLTGVGDIFICLQQGAIDDAQRIRRHCCGSRAGMVSSNCPRGSSTAQPRSSRRRMRSYRQRRLRRTPPYGEPTWVRALFTSGEMKLVTEELRALRAAAVAQANTTLEQHPGQRRR
jgi:hypothetical protein